MVNVFAQPKKYLKGLEADLEDKLDDKVLQLSQQFGIPQSKVREIILSLVDKALETEEQEKSEIPY